MSNYDFTSNEFKGLLSSKLDSGIVRLRFRKADGTERAIACTRRDGLVIRHEPKTDRAKKTISENVCVVFDVMIGEWRSFRYDSIITVDSNLE